MTWIFDPLPRNQFKVIMADPPWKFSAGTKGRPQHYDRMTDNEIARLPVEELAHPDGCWLFLWVTSPKIFHIERIAETWGFRYSGRAFVWIKTERAENDPLFVFSDSLHMGQGFTTRKNAEDCLLFRRGSPKRLSASVHEVILSPVRAHSRKPDEAYRRAQQYAEGPYCELFSRESREGWATWGNQVGKFDEVAA
ncbi:DNA methyltransferase [Microvirga sp. KLBC 81]|uniref:MT-A70 family methyltransferase n=1 Tax=Microvirga sp. KLBC 81 TaxID=1862707 RepID=UPI000D51B406|nr:MT-A70 family methyltransferase [Microvirga sp. KLBC 81]PVE25405.1 DNA methyltransferase [Microvirga sp. KLBC 81]